MKMSEDLETLANEIIRFAGTKDGEVAKIKYDILRLAEERRRNKIAFSNTILLSVIAIANLVLAYLKFRQDHQ